MANRLFWATFALLALTGTLRADNQPEPEQSEGESLPPLPARFARPQINDARLAFHFDGPDSQSRDRRPADTQAPTRGAGLAPTRPSMIAAGLALSLSVVTSGLWLARGRNRRFLGGGVLLVAVVLGVSGLILPRSMVAEWAKKLNTDEIR